MAKVIRCKVTDEYVQGSGIVIGAAGSHDDVLIELSFSDVWEGTTKQIVWCNALGENPTVILLTADMRAEEGGYLVPVPFEAKEVAGDCSMTVRGAKTDGKVETSATLTTVAYFRVLPSAWEVEEGQDITPSQAVAMQAQIDTILSKIDRATEGADAADEAAASAEAAAASAEAAAASEAISLAAQKAAEKARDEAREIADAKAEAILVSDETAAIFGFSGNASVDDALGVAGEKLYGVNLLRNWYFVDPINRRGQTEYGGTAWMYTIDGWKTSNANTTVTVENGVRIAAYIEGSTPFLIQVIQNGEALLGKTVTLSVMLGDGTVKTATVTMPTANLDNGQSVITIADVAFLTYMGSSVGWCVRLTAAKSSANTFLAVKLEVGSVQTLAHQDADGNWVLNDPPPDKGMELLKCIQSTADPNDTYANKTIATKEEFAAGLFGNQYVWKRRVYQEKTEEEVGDTALFYILAPELFATSGTTLYYSNTYTVDYKTGLFKLTDPTTAVIGEDDAEFIGAGGGYVIPDASEGTTMYAVSDWQGPDTISDCYATEHTAAPTIGDWIYLFSEDSNAYPHGGITDGYEYDYRGSVASAIYGAKITAGSYSGTGLSGSSNPCTLTFDFQPKFVMVRRHKVSNGGDDGFTAIYGEELAMACTLQWGKNSVSWYSAGSASQYNQTGVLYHYVAIG